MKIPNTRFEADVQERRAAQAQRWVDASRRLNGLTDGHLLVGPQSAAQPEVAADLRCANLVCSADAADPRGR